MTLTPTPVLLALGPAANHHTPGRPGDKGLPGPGAPPLKPALIAYSCAQRPQGDPTAPRTADRKPCHCHGGTRAPPSPSCRDPSSRWAACPHQGHLLPGRPLSATEALTDPPSRFSLGLRPDMLFSAFLPPLLCSLGLASPYGPSAPLKGRRCWAVLGPSPAAATSLGDSLVPWPPPHGPRASSHAAARPGSPAYVPCSGCEIRDTDPSALEMGEQRGEPYKCPGDHLKRFSRPQRGPTGLLELKIWGGQTTGDLGESIREERPMGAPTPKFLLPQPESELQPV